MEVQEIAKNVQQDINEFLDNYKAGVVVIRGSTATGKSNLSILLNEFFDQEIISADSRQIYKYMDIGTDKIPMQFREKIPHHQIDIVDPDRIYSAGEWKADTESIVESVIARGKLPVVVGGTGLYIDTIYQNFSLPKVEPDFSFRDKLYEREAGEPGFLHKELSKVDPVEASKIHPNSTRYLVRALEIFEKTGQPKSQIVTTQPVKWPILMIGLWREKEDANIRINKRIDEMFVNGLIEEVKYLLDRGYDTDLPSMQGIGYKEIVGYIKGEYDKFQAIDFLKTNTQHYAKRQRTWFRRYINDSKTNPKGNVIYKLYQL